jgi:Mce-associated membrane protein
MTTTNDSAMSEAAVDTESRVAAEDADEPSNIVGPGAARRSRKQWITRAVAVLLVVGAVAGAGYGGWLLYQQQQQRAAAQDALRAAEAYAVVLTSIDTNTIDQNFTDVLDGSTGEFHDMYSKASGELRQLLLDNKAAAQGTVRESAVQSATPERVVVLLFVDQSITNTSAPDPRIDRSRIKMTMDKVDGRWLAGKVELP